jgi:hypothetical protein
MGIYCCAVPNGARIHVERAIAADYDRVLRGVAACLFIAAKARTA